MTDLYPVPAEDAKLMLAIYRYTLTFMVGAAVTAGCLAIGVGAIASVIVGSLTGGILVSLLVWRAEKRASRKQQSVDTTVDVL